MMVPDEVWEEIESRFSLPSYFDMYNLVEETRTLLKLSEPVSDEERLAQVKWVKEQFRKYVFSKQDEILGFGANLVGMRDYLLDLINKASESPKSAKECIYQYVRNMWLIGTYNAILVMHDMMAELEDDGEE